MPSVPPHIVAQYILSQTYARVRHGENLDILKMGLRSLQAIRGKFGPPSEALKILAKGRPSELNEHEISTTLIDYVLSDQTHGGEDEDIDEDIGALNLEEESQCILGIMRVPVRITSKLFIPSLKLLINTNVKYSGIASEGTCAR